MLKTKDKTKPIIIAKTKRKTNTFSKPSDVLSFKIAGRIQIRKPRSAPQINIPLTSLKIHALIPFKGVSPSKIIQENPVRPKARNQTTNVKGIPLANTGNFGLGNN